MLVIFGGQKGGSGKSTHAALSTIWRMQEGRDVLLADTDPQGSANEFKSERERNGITPLINLVTLTGDQIATQLQDLKKRYQDIVLDCPGMNSVEMRKAMLVADVIVTPCRPARFDATTMVNMSDTISDARIVNPRLKAYAFINSCSANRNSTREERVREFVREYCPSYTLMDPMVAHRVAFFDVAEFGATLEELTPRDPAAIAEARAVYQEIWK